MVGCQRILRLGKVQRTKLDGNPFTILPDPAALTGVTFPPGEGGGGKFFFFPFPKAERRRGEHEMRSGDDALSARASVRRAFRGGKGRRTDDREGRGATNRSGIEGGR